MNDIIPDLANALIRETYRSKGARSLAVQTARSPLALRKALVHARRFVADDSMSSFMAELATVPFKVASERWHDILASLRHTAKLPFPSIFLQYNNRAFRRRLMQIGEGKQRDVWGMPLKNVGEAEVTPYLGWLFEQDPHDDGLIWMQVFVDLDDAAVPAAMPMRYAYRTDDRGFDPRLGIDTRPNEITTGLTGCNDSNIGLRYAMPMEKMAKHLKAQVKDERPGGEDFQMHFMVGEFSGDLRYALTLLATLNDIPKIETVVRPQKSYMGGGQIRKYLDYTTLRLTLPVKVTTTTMAKRLIAAARRGWHIVRPHWRLIHPRMGDKFCKYREDHLWLEADESGHANCKLCDARRVWIVLPTGRGDPNISVRTHKYALHHAEV